MTSILLQAQFPIQVLGCDPFSQCSRSSSVKVAMEVVEAEVEVEVVAHHTSLDK